MIKKNKQIAPLCILAALLLFCILLYTSVSATWDEYKSIGSSSHDVDSKLQLAKTEYEKSKDQKKQDEIQLQSIKPVYETKEDSETENLGVFGSMFEDIIKKIQSDGLLVRSIEYDMRPPEDPIYLSYSNIYNVCELKFFLVGTYSQLKVFLNEMANNFPNLISISKLNITAFNGNTDYILISMSITLYSKKPASAK